MNIYVASSWRNTFQPWVVEVLRADGHRVYDFKGSGDGWGGDGEGPGGFGWKEVDPDWQNWPNDIPRYLEGLKHPRAIQGFRRDMDALEQSDACVMVGPCGPSASMEMGWAVGANRHVYVYLPGMREPDLMVKMADLVTTDFSEIRNLLLKTTPKPRDAMQRRIGAWYIGNGGGASPAKACNRAMMEMVELTAEMMFENHAKAKEELADVVICLSVLADKLGCDLAEEVRKKMDINEQRKWAHNEDGTLSHIKGSDPRGR